MHPLTSNLDCPASQVHALGSYRHDVAYTAALKSCHHALGSYRQDVAYTAALKSASSLKTYPRFTGVEHCLAPVIFFVTSVTRKAG